MKKSLVALAVLAAAGAASAQSSVTLYGVADIWFGSFKDDVGVRQIGVQDGGFSNSRWGITGSEDLGGGLKANFLLEQGFSIDSGAADSGFNRTSWIGLSGGFGEVQIGQPWNAFDDVSALASSTFDSDLAPINTVFATTGAADSDNNAIKYITPSFGGFSGSVSYAFGEDKTATTSASDTYAISAMYEAGALVLGLGYFNADSADTYDVGTGKVSATRLAATYDLGAVQLLASYGRGKAVVGADTTKISEWELGVNVPLSEALTLSAGYARSKWKENGAKSFESDGFGAAVAYSLSKRTTVYAGFNNTDEEDVPSTGTTKLRTYAVGVKHTF